MIKIIDTRDTGKTKKLLTEISSIPGSVIVCKHPHNIINKCIAYGIKPVDAIGYEDYLEIIKGDVQISPNRKVYIDEVVEFVEAISPKLDGYTLTID